MGKSMPTSLRPLRKQVPQSQASNGNDQGANGHQGRRGKRNERASARGGRGWVLKRPADARGAAGPRSWIGIANPLPSFLRLKKVTPQSQKRVLVSKKSVYAPVAQSALGPSAQTSQAPKSTWEDFPLQLSFSSWEGNQFPPRLSAVGGPPFHPPPLLIPGGTPVPHQAKRRGPPFLRRPITKNFLPRLSAVARHFCDGQSRNPLLGTPATDRTVLYTVFPSCDDGATF